MSGASRWLEAFAADGPPRSAATAPMAASAAASAANASARIGVRLPSRWNDRERSLRPRDRFDRFGGPRRRRRVLPPELSGRVGELERLELVRWLEAEDAAGERERGFDRPPDVLLLAEAV